MNGCTATDPGAGSVGRRLALPFCLRLNPRPYPRVLSPSPSFPRPIPRELHASGRRRAEQRRAQWLREGREMRSFLPTGADGSSPSLSTSDRRRSWSPIGAAVYCSSSPVTSLLSPFFFYPVSLPRASPTSVTSRAPTSGSPSQDPGLLRRPSCDALLCLLRGRPHRWAGRGPYCGAA
jgi:hypothetical protein